MGLNNLGRQGRIRLALWVVVLIGLAAALRSAAHRWSVERDNRRVEIALDYTELRNMAAAEGMPLSAVLRRFREAGATSVTLQEDTVANLEDARLIREVEADSRGVTLLYGRPATLARIQVAFQAKTRYPMTVVPAATPLPFGIPQDFTAGLRIAEPPSLVRPIGIGLPPEAVRTVRGAGLGIVGRVNNWDGVSPQGITWTLHDLAKNGASTVVFLGDEVLGYKGYVTDDPKDPVPVSTVSVLRGDGLYYGTVEFGKQKGDPELSKAAEDRLVRVHTVTGSEMQTADIPGNIQRFLLAARERDIRILYVRLFPNEREGQRDALEINADDYVRVIANGLEGKDAKGHPLRLHRSDLATGLAHGFSPLGVGRAPRLLMGLGVAAGWLLLVDSVTGLFGAGAAGLAVAWIAATVAALLALLPLWPSHLGAKLVALGAACVFPSLALLRKDMLAPVPGQPPLGVALLRFLKACAITALGVAFLVGLLADRSFLLKTDVFLGIKPAKLIPVLLVAVVYAFGLRAEGRRTWRQAFVGARDRIARLGTQPILLWQIGAAALALIVLALVVLRSGNDPGVGVSGTELKVRALLDRLLPTRPRFQEFLIGHPALILSLVLAVRGWRKWAFPLFLVGSIGQVSLLNTFCHIHTPLYVSLWRASLGILIGALIALALYLPLDRWLLRRLSPPAARVEPER